MSYYADPDAYLAQWHGLDTPAKLERARLFARALASLTAAPPAAVPADRPTSTLVGSACLTTETHEPAGPR